MFRSLLTGVVICCLARVSAFANTGNDVLHEDYRYYQNLASAPQQIAVQLHADFQYLTAYGTALSKTQLLTYLEKSPQLVDQFELTDRQVWVNGDYAVLIGTALTAGKDAKFNRVESRYWHVWTRVDDSWKLLLRQAELMTPKPAL